MRARLAEIGRMVIARSLIGRHVNDVRPLCRRMPSHPSPQRAFWVRWVERQRGGGCPSPRLGRVDGYSRIDDSANGLVGAIKITVIRLTVALTVAPSEAPVSALFAAASINPVVGGPRCNDRDQRRREQSRHNVPSPPRRRPSEGG